MSDLNDAFLLNPYSWRVLIPRIVVCILREIFICMQGGNNKRIEYSKPSRDGAAFHVSRINMFFKRQFMICNRISLPHTMSN